MTDEQEDAIDALPLSDCVAAVWDDDFGAVASKARNEALEEAAQLIERNLAAKAAELDERKKFGEWHTHAALQALTYAQDQAAAIRALKS
jgi:hypothetical protein